MHLYLYYYSDAKKINREKREGMKNPLTFRWKKKHILRNKICVWYNGKRDFLS